MSEPVFFVVQRAPGGGEFPALFYGHLPATLTRKIPRGSSELPPLVAAWRLDKFADAERWLAMSPSELYAVYCRLRDAGKLPPPNLADPPRVTAPSERKAHFGDWWTWPVRPWADQT